MAKIDLGLPSYDTLFSSEKERSSNEVEKITDIPLNEIQDFKDHPFHVIMDEDMIKLIESIEINGQLMPVLVRPTNHGYEMIAGHRRKYAMQKLGIEKIKAIVKTLDDDQATILMVDSNVQREHILPSERAFAYKMRLDAMKHQGKALLEDTTCAQVEYKSKPKKSIEILSELIGINRNQIRRFIRLTYLIEPLRNMVDNTHPDNIVMSFNPAVELSYLSETEQYDLLNSIESLMCTPSLVQAQTIKKASRDGTLTPEYLQSVLEKEKPIQVVKNYVQWSKYDKYFPKNYTQEQKDKVVEKLLSSWQKRRERETQR